MPVLSSETMSTRLRKDVESKSDLTTESQQDGKYQH